MSLLRPKVRSDLNKTRRFAGRRRRSVTQNRRRHLAVPLLQVLEPRHLLAFSTELFADINQFGVSSLPDSFIEYNSQVFFVADDGVSGSELWKSDGTPEGTVRVADINPGPIGSEPSGLTVFGNDLYFTALDEDDEFDLWKTDGTTAGTIRVFDADAAGVFEISQLTASGNRLFFTAYQSASGYELWATDGTSSGTALVKDINPDQTIAEGPLELTDVNGKLFFTSYTNGYDNRELFESDGTAIGTVLVANLDGDPLESSSPHHLTNVNGTLYFAADDPATGVELYKSTGAAGATVRVADLNVGSGSSYPESLTEFNGQLFFTAHDGTMGRQLFKSDGITVTLVANTSPGASGSSSPSELTVVGNELFFVANGGNTAGPVVANQPALSAANSFRGGSGHFVGVVAIRANAYQGTVSAATSAGSYVLTAQTGSSSDGPGWVSSGARIGSLGVGLSGVEVGDLIIQDLDLGSEVSDATWEWTIADPAGLVGIDFSGFVSGNEFDEAGEAILFELFLNGAATRTSFLQVSGDDLDNWYADRDADNLALSHAGGEAITSATVRMTFRPDGGPQRMPDESFEAIVLRASLTATGLSSGTVGRELHKTDGTTTSLVKDLVSPGSSAPTELTEVDGKLFFSAQDPLALGRELWVSDGTESGTGLVRDLRSGFDLYGAPLSGDPRNLTSVNGKLFFSAVDDWNDREVWVSDGMTAGTDLVKNINTGTQDANVQQFVEVGSKLFFVADDGINGEAVWVADRSLGTVAIAADVTASANDRVNGLAKFGNGVIFHNDSLGVYSTDGITTTALTSATPVPFNDEGDLFLEVGMLAYFVTSDAANGQELWKTNGTAAGTSLVADLYAGTGSSQPRDLVGFQDRVFFSADYLSSSGVSLGRELFRSDGSQFGTQLVQDINYDPDPGLPAGPNTLSSDPLELTVSGAKLYFSAVSGVNNGDLGRELWAVSSAFGGAALVRDIRTGANSSSPQNLTDVNGVLYFSAHDGSSGFEPFRSQGTSVTTTLVANVNPGTGSSNPDHFFPSGSRVYFSAFTPTTGTELFSTDGTSAGTALVVDLQPGIDSSDPLPLGGVTADRLLVSASANGTLDRELWITGGPVSGMLPVFDLNPGEFFGSNPSDLIPNGTEYLFAADDGTTGRELRRLSEAATQIESVVVDDGTEQRSTVEQVQVIFDAQVQISGDPFQLLNLSTGQSVVADSLIEVQDGKTVVRFTFQPGDSVNAAGLLMDGDYRLTIDASLVSSLGIALDGDGDGGAGGDFVFGASAVDRFYRKFGEGNGNGTVDLLDFAGFRRAFGLNQDDPDFNRVFDNDGDGTVGLLDFAEFRRNFGT